MFAFGADVSSYSDINENMTGHSPFVYLRLCTSENSRLTRMATHFLRSENFASALSPLCSVSIRACTTLVVLT